MHWFVVVVQSTDHRRKVYPSILLVQRLKALAHAQRAVAQAVRAAEHAVSVVEHAAVAVAVVELALVVVVVMVGRRKRRVLALVLALVVVVGVEEGVQCRRVDRCNRASHSRAYRYRTSNPISPTNPTHM